MAELLQDVCRSICQTPHARSMSGGSRPYYDCAYNQGRFHRRRLPGIARRVIGYGSGPAVTRRTYAVGAVLFLLARERIPCGPAPQDIRDLSQITTTMKRRDQQRSPSRPNRTILRSNSGWRVDC
jgi:hypothetical protein